MKLNQDMNTFLSLQLCRYESFCHVIQIHYIIPVLQQSDYQIPNKSKNVFNYRVLGQYFHWCLENYRIQRHQADIHSIKAIWLWTCW